MYPLLLKPSVKDYLWGGTKLKTEYGCETELEKAAEAWMLSCHSDGPSIVSNGIYKGKTLPEVLKILGKEAIGRKAAEFPYFPLLIKLIDAKDKLSVQVHPDDSYALKNEGEYGKTEMWYVVDCKEGSSLIYGFNRKLSKEEFKERIINNTLEEVCNYVPVHKGDVFFIESGTLHAIGDGIIIAEVQQNSNSTYRVSDYGRLGADGKPRQLHIDKALEVTYCDVPKIPYGDTGEIVNETYGKVRQLAKCKFFNSKLLNLSGNTDVFNSESFISLIVLDGNISLFWNEEKIECKKGYSVFVPAGLKINISGNADILYSAL